MSLFSIISAVLLLAMLVWLLKQPPTFRVVRGRTIHAPIGDIYPLLQDLRRWPDWSPWLIHEPNAMLDHSDTSDEVGSWYRWTGDKIGAGRITHSELQVPQHLTQSLEFFKPMRSTNQVRFDLTETTTDETRVEWSMEGKLPFLFRWMGSMMDRMVGGDFELGLVQLAREAGDTTAQLQIQFEGRVHTDPAHYCAQAFEGPAQTLPQVLQEQFSAMLETASQQGLKLTAEPFVLYHHMDASTGQVRCDMCLPLPEGQVMPGYDQGTLPGLTYERTRMNGDYRFLPLAWHAAFGHLRMSKLKQNKKQPMVERYKTDPQTMQGLEIVIYIDLPVS